MAKKTVKIGVSVKAARAKQSRGGGARPRAKPKAKAQQAPTTTHPLPVMQVTPPPPKLPVPGKTEAGKDYSACVLGVGPSKKGAQIPDGLDCETMTLAQKVTISVLPDAQGNISGWVEPGLPAGLKIGAGTFSTPTLYTGSTGAATVTYTAAAMYAPSVPAIGIPFSEEVQGTANNTAGSYTCNFRGMTRARFVGGKLTLTPTGPPLTRQGMIAIADVEVDRPLGTGINNVSGFPDPSRGGGSGPINALANQPTRFTFSGYGPRSYLPYSVVSEMPGAVVCEYGEVACHALVKPGTLHGAMKPVEPEWTDVGPGVAVGFQVGDTMLDISGLSTTGNSGQGAWGSAVGAQYPYFGVANQAETIGTTPPYVAMTGNYWTEQGVKWKVFSATGLASNQPLMITYDQCVESCVIATSQWRNMLRPVPKADVAALAGAKALTKKLPASLSAAPSKPWYSTLASVLAAVGQGVATLGIPGVSTAAGVISSAANAFGNMVL